jgi:hypothetical protein
LRPIPFSLLRQALSSGQVIVINASQYGVDALIFGETGPIEHVPLPHIHLETVAELASDIVFKLPANHSTTRRESYINRYLKPTLRVIWNNVVIKIFNKIQISLADHPTMLTGFKI